MALSKQEIDDIVGYFSTKNTARANTINFPAKHPGSTGGGAIPASIQAAQKAGKQAQRDRLSTPAHPKRPNPVEMIMNVLFHTQTKPITDIFEPMDEQERPRNSSQAVLNALSTGTYMGANTAEEAGKHLAAAERATKAGNWWANKGELLQASPFVAPFVGGLRGLGEGFGMRFDHDGDGEPDRPRTYGQDFEAIGLNDAIRTGTKNLGATDDGSHFVDNPNTYVAGAGLAADIIGDPFALASLGTTGFVKGIRGGAQAAGRAIREETAALAPGVSARHIGGAGLVRAAKRAVQGGSEARHQYLIGLNVARANKAAGKAERKAASGTQGVTVEAQRAADDAARLAAGDAAPVVDDAVRAADAPEMRPEPVQAPDSAVIPAAVAESAADVADPRLAAVNALLPDLHTVGKDVPAEDILASAAATGAPAKLTPETTGLVRTALNDATKVPELRAALKAIKATKDGKAFLATTIKLRGQETTMGAALESAAMRRITGGAEVGGVGSGANHALLAGFNKVLDRFSAPGKGQMTPDSLEEAIRAALPDAGQLDAASLHERMLTATPSDRLDILREVLGAGGESFKTFDEAIAASVDGQVEASMMRSMLHALGVPTKAATDGGLRKALATKGVLNWEQIKNSIPTPREVLDAHDIDAVTEEAAKAVNVDEVLAAAAGEVDEAAAEAERISAGLGVDFAAGTTAEHLPNPAVGGGSTMRLLMKELAAKMTPHTEELTPFKEWWEPFRLIVGNRAQAANRAVSKGGATGLVGAERGDFLYGGVLADLRQIEAYQRSLGSMPYIRRFKKDRPLYVSFGQILDALPEDVVKQSLFDLNYRASKFGKGKTDEAAAAFHNTPLTVLPTTYTNGVWAALEKNPTVDTITKAMLSGRNKKQKAGIGSFEWSAEGEDAIRRVAEAMAEPGFADELRDLHEAQEIIALAFVHKAADDIIAPLASKFIDAVATDADRSVVIAAINAIKAEIPKIAPGLDRSLVRDMVEQRSSNGILQSLGEAGVALARNDARAAARGGNRTAKEQLGKQAEVAARRGKGEKGTGKHDNNAARTAGSQDARAHLDDMAPLANDAVEEQVALGVLEDTDIERILTQIEFDHLNGIASPFSKIGRAFNGDHGMEHAKNVQISASSGSFNSSDDFVATLRTFAVGGKLGRGVAFGGKRGTYVGVDRRLGQDLGLGRKASDDEIKQHLRLWASSLAQHVSRLQDAHGVPPTTEELRLALQAGAKNVEPLSDAQADMAMEFKRLMDEIWAPVDGPLARSGIATSDAIREMGRIGLDKNLMPDDTESLADNAGIWMTFKWAEIPDPLNVLSSWHRAISAAKVPQTVAAEMSRLFDHRSGGLGKVMSGPEAKAAGWKRVDRDNSEGSFLAPYIDPESYFPPELFTELTHVDNFFKQMQTPMGNNLLRRRIMPTYDFVVDTLKSLNTVVNPAHHVGNVLGDTAMLAIDGINPGYVVRAQRVLTAGGKMSTLDDDLLSMLHSSYRRTVGEGQPVSEKWNAKWLGAQAGTTRVNVNGTMVDIPAEQLWQEAMARGVAVTARQSKDKYPMNDISSVLGRRWVREAQRYNPYTHLDRFAGEFSATRDNYTRIAHFMGALEDGKFSSIDAALEAATKRVHDFHPTIQGLSAFDQKVTRRVIFFHTWVRKAADIIVRTALEKPGVIAAPSKLQYNVAESQGFNPESFGAPAGDDERIASYGKESLLGPTFSGGYTPLGGPGDLDEGEAPHLWGISLSMPQLDALQALFGGVPLGDTPGGPASGAYEALVGNLNPILKAGIEWPTHSKIGGVGGDPQKDPAGYIAQQTGMPYRLAGAVGLRQKRDLSKAKNDEERAAWAKENAGEQARTLFNWVSGLKAIDYTNPTSARVADRERGDWERKTLQDLGYDDAQIKEIRGIWKEQRLTT